MIWFGKPVPQNRFLGLVDSDDPTNLPSGLASLCRNIDFARDAGGPTQATVRAGVNTAMQCVDHESPVTGMLGFVYSPESAADPFFQLPMAFQPTVGSQYESPVGSGTMNLFPQTNFQEPALEALGISPHAIQASAGNRVFSAYSDLKVALSAMSNMDPRAKTMNSFGMKPVGFYWQPGIQVLKGEVCCPAAPTTGNGHTYQAQNSGTTGPFQPVFSASDAEGETFNDNGIIWKEKTMVIANRLLPPAQPTVTGHVPGSNDIYVVITLLNTIGETLPSVPVLTQNAFSVSLLIPALASMPGWIQNLPAQYIPTAANVYVGSVVHGSPAPALSSYGRAAASVALGAPLSVSVGSPPAPPTFCSARVTPGQLPTPTVEPQIQRVPAGSLVARPAQPVVELINGAGSAFTHGQVIDVDLSLVNPSGETTIGTAAVVAITADGQGIKVFLAGNYGPTVTGVNIWLSTNGFSGGTGSKDTGSPYALGSSPTLLGFGPSTPIPVNNTAVVAAGAFVAARDVYVAQTYRNSAGETPIGPPNTMVNTNANDAVMVTVAAPLGPDNEQLYTISSIGIYEADVPTGTAAPAPSQYSLVGYFQPGATPFILQTVNGANPPITNTTGSGGAIVADTLTGGANGTQGFRYAAIGWINQMETFSGFTLASVVSTIIDEDGWEIGAFNVLTGMPNVVGRYIAFTIADGSQDGPFNWLGLVDLLQPAQNVVYPMQTLIDQVNQSATVILDNVTTQAIFNFTDTYLDFGNNVDDRMDIAIPPQGVRVDYLESVSRLAVSGVPGFASGVWISLELDPESFYADLGPVPISSAGDVCYGVTDKYKGIIFAMMKSGGFALGANTGQPGSWSATRRWGGVDPGEQLGPCGFRAWAACGKFIIFAHRSGLYKYDMSDPDLMSKEVPKLWDSINWAVGYMISVTIDEDTHTVRVLVPTLGSMVPNKELALSYIEGWNNPIHFSTFSGKEISMDAARRWAQNDVSAFICSRMERTLPPGGNAYLDGPTFETLPESSFQLTQLLYASSGPDGTVQARTPGIFSDNGTGIDGQYETMSNGMMQAVCKPEGFNLNAAGQGIMLPSFVASRAQVTDEGGETKLVVEEEELQMEPIALTVKQISGITRKCGPAVNEFWRTRFRTDGQPGSWFSLKAMTSYVIPVTPGRDSGDL